MLERAQVSSQLTDKLYDLSIPACDGLTLNTNCIGDLVITTSVEDMEEENEQISLVFINT